MKTTGIWSPNRYQNWNLRRTPSGDFTATSPDFAIVEIDNLHWSMRGQFVSAPDRMALIAEIDGRVGL